ncbi:TRIM2_3 [Mytilus edulis]|uniref:TRIM2_3 n=1 Tax=Mytilus edulis TaxID=6550 RepID=A0A8S3VHJ5_MYTED|nr:TRIM2_3 [Mytilus edulis]
MTAPNVVEQIEDTFLSCSICLQCYNQPKALPCLHTFCEGCIEDYIKKFTGTGNQGSVQFPCPICRLEVTLPEGGVSAFPYNHLITSLKDTILSSSLSQNQSGSKGDRPDFPLTERPTSKKSSLTFSQRFGQFDSGPEGFVNISGLAVCPKTGRIIIADCSKNTITIYIPDGDTKNVSFKCDCSIRDVAVTKAGSILVTVSRSGNAILREYTTDGRLIAQYGDVYKSENPFGIAISKRERIIVSSLQRNRVHIFTDRKKHAFSFGTGGETLEQFLFPYYITTNSKNDIIVSDSGNHRIKVHKTDGSIRCMFGSQGSALGSLFYPMGICVDDYDNIFVADANNYRVQLFSPKGEFLACPVQNTFQLGIDVKPVCVAYTKNQLIVSLRGTRFSEIQIYDCDTSKFKSRPKACCSCCFFRVGHTDEPLEAWS